MVGKVPIIEISGGILTPEVGWRALAAVTFPDDAELRQAYATIESKSAAEQAHLIELSREAMYGQGVAGCLLQWICAHAQLGKPATLGGAIKLWAKAFRHERKLGGRKVGTSRAGILREWGHFKDVAPLLAAASLCVFESVGEPQDLGTGHRGALLRERAIFLNAFLDPAQLPGTLARAEHFRRFGENYVPPRAHCPLLDRATTWKVPTEVKLPWVLMPTHYPPFSP